MVTVEPQDLVEQQAPAAAEEDPQARIDREINGLIVWHMILAATCVFGVISGLSPSADGLPTIIRSIIVGGSLAGIALNVAAVPLLRRRSFWGRLASLTVNYLAFIGFVATVLTKMDVFTGLDEFAAGFEDAIWYLVIVGVGWGWVTLARRITGDFVGTRYLEYAGYAIIVGGAVAFLVVVGVGDGVAHMVGELADGWAIFALAGAVVTGIAVRVMWRGDMGRVFGTTFSRDESLNGYFFLSPNLLGFLFFFAGPLIFSLAVSFWDWDALGDKTFTGLSNYIELLSLDFAIMDNGAVPATDALKNGYVELWRFEIFGQNILISARDKLFWLSMRNILFFLVLAVPLATVPALFLASLLNSKLRGMKFFRAIYFVPSVAGVIGVTLIWKQLYNATVGWLNYIITRAKDIFDFIPGIEGGSQTEIQWLSSEPTALLSIVIVFAWMTFGFNTVLFVAGLQGIPKDLYEAADIDGAGPWAKFRHITVPLLRSTTFFVVATTTILAIQLFDIVFVLTAPEPGSPNNSTLTPVLYLYERGFQQFDQGYASAVAWVLFIIIFGITILQFRRQQKMGEITL